MYIIVVLSSKYSLEQYVYNDKGYLTYHRHLSKKFFRKDIPYIVEILYSGKPPYSITIMEV